MGKNPDVAAAGIEPWRHLMSQRGAPLHLKNISCVNGNSSKVVKRIRRKVIFPVKESTGNWTNSSLSLFCGRPAARPFLLPSAIVSFPTSDCTWREKHKFSSFFLFPSQFFHFEKKRIKNFFLPMTQHFLLAQRVVTARETDKKNGKVDYRPPAAYTISLPIKIWLRKRNKPVAMSLSWWEHFLLIPPRGSSPKYNCSNGIRNCCRDNEPTHFHRHRWNVVGDQRAECQFTNFCVILQIFAYRRTLLSARMILLVALFPANHIWIITGTDLRRQSSQRPSRQCELVNREILFLFGFSIGPLMWHKPDWPLGWDLVLFFSSWATGSFASHDRPFCCSKTARRRDLKKFLKNFDICDEIPKRRDTWTMRPSVSSFRGKKQFEIIRFLLLGEKKRE